MSSGQSTQIADLKEVQARQAGFKGGVNTRDAINRLAPDQMVAGENILLDEGGGAGKRPGCTSMGTVGPTVGVTVIGSTVNNMAVDRKNVTRHVSPTGGITISEVWVYLDGFGPGSGTATLKAVLYADSAGNPAALLGTSNEVSVPSGMPAQWVKFTFSVPVAITAGTNFHEGLHAGGATNVARFFAETTGGTRTNGIDTYSDGPSNPFGAINFSDAFKISWYASDSTERIISCYTFYRSGSVPQVIIHTSSGKLYYTNDPFANPVVWTLITSGLSTTAPMAFETFNSKCYMSNGVDDYAAWDGAARTTFASAPKGKYLRLWKDAMWVSGITGFPDRAYSSDAGNAESFGVASWVDLSKGDGDSTSALGTDGLFLIVGKKNKTQVIYDPVTFANRVVDFEKGIESHFSMQQHEGSIYFLSRRGICRYLGDAPSEILSDLLDPIFAPQVLNLNALDKTVAYVYENRIGWAIPEVGQVIPSVQIEYYPRLAGVTAFGNRGTGPFTFHRMPVTTFTRVRSGTEDRLFGGHATANKFLWVFSTSGTDDGATFQSVAETAAFNLGTDTLTKYIRRIRLLGRGKFNMQVKRNFGTAIYKTYPVDLTDTSQIWDIGSTWDISSEWGPGELVHEGRVDTDLFGRFFQLRFIDVEVTAGSKPVRVGSQNYSVPTGEWAIYGAIMEGSQLGVRE